MMTEISLNILDITENSIRAGANLICITVDINPEKDTLSIEIKDDGCGMDEEQVKNVVDPFYTTRTTRKVGLGVPFFKLAAESSGGTFSIQSQKNVGTVINAVFVLSSIDRMPLGDINSTIYTLIAFNTSIDFVYKYCYADKEFTLDTREFKEILGGVPLDSPDVLNYMKEFLKENKDEVDGGKIL